MVRATLGLPESDGFLRAEVILYEHGAADGVTDDFMVSQMHAYAADNGLLNPEVRVTRGPAGRCSHLRAVKRLQQVRAIYENTACYGPSSMMMLYVGARADVFPPPGATAFASSLELVAR